MLEFTVAQLIGLVSTIIDFGEKRRINPAALSNYPVRLLPPLPDGSIKFDIGLPIAN